MTSRDLRLARVKQSLTTSDKKPSERLEFWQEVVCKKYVSAFAETDVVDDEFSGSLTSGELGPLVVAELNAPLHFWSRNSRATPGTLREGAVVARRLRLGIARLIRWALMIIWPRRIPDFSCVRLAHAT